MLQLSLHTCSLREDITYININIIHLDYTLYNKQGGLF